MILAAGYGTRLAPVTDTLPKALVPADGRPMICHAIDALVRAGCTGLIVNAHHHADQIERHFATTPVPVPVTVVREREILGTGGGILHARAWLDGDEPFFVHNADIVTDADLGVLFRSCVASDALATLLVQHRGTKRALLFDARMHLMGREAWFTGDPPPAGDVRRFAFCGIHVIAPRLFRLATFTGFADILDIYRPLIASGEPIVGIPHAGAFHDLGSIEKIRAFERARGTD